MLSDGLLIERRVWKRRWLHRGKGRKCHSRSPEDIRSLRSCMLLVLLKLCALLDGGPGSTPARTPCLATTPMPTECPGLRSPSTASSLRSSPVATVDRVLGPDGWLVMTRSSGSAGCLKGSRSSILIPVRRTARDRRKSLRSELGTVSWLAIAALRTRVCALLSASWRVLRHGLVELGRDDVDVDRRVAGPTIEKISQPAPACRARR